ncbi:hypothetical protein D9M71_489500 [compost metagenome]
MPLDLALSEMAHAVHELVPTGDGYAELLLHCLRIEACVMRHLNRTRCAVQGYGQCVVAHHPNGGGCCRGCQGAVAGGGQ